MHTLGKKLEEARTKKGISIREASESIKVRGDFLIHFENNDFKFNLPDIYKRGFLRNYARLLELDGEEILEEFELLNKPSKKQAKRDAREYLGKIELNEDTLPPDNPPNKKMHPDPKFATGGISRTIPLSASSAQEQKNPPMSTGRSGNSSSTRQQPQLGDSKNDANDMYVKIPIYIASTFVLIILIWVFISMIGNSNNEEMEIEDVKIAESYSDSLLQSPIDGPKKSILPTLEAIYAIALNDVEVKIRQEYDKKMLLNKQLKRGDRIQLMKQGPVKIYCSEVSDFRIGKNNKEYTMGTSGPATTEFN